MNNKDSKLNLFYPQWQGGGPDQSTYYGAHELKQNYCLGLSFTEIAVNRSEQKVNDQKIYQFDQIMAQTETARQVIDTLRPRYF